MTNPCTEQNCERQIFKDGLCQFHYMKWATNPKKVFSHIQPPEGAPRIIIPGPTKEKNNNILGTVVANLALLWLALFLFEQVIKLGSRVIQLIFG